MILTRADVIEMLRRMPPRARGRRTIEDLLVKITNAELEIDVAMEKAARDEIRSAA